MIYTINIKDSVSRAGLPSDIYEAWHRCSRVPHYARVLTSDDSELSEEDLTLFCVEGIKRAYIGYTGPVLSDIITRRMQMLSEHGRLRAYQLSYSYVRHDGVSRYRETFVTENRRTYRNVITEFAGHSFVVADTFVRPLTCRGYIHNGDLSYGWY